jgi:hypothetical protein
MVTADAARLRELCERASKEYDHEKLLDLVRQINDLLEKGGTPATQEEGSRSGEEKKKARSLLWGAVAVNLIAKSAEGWLDLARWGAPARG